LNSSRTSIEFYEKHYEIEETQDFLVMPRWAPTEARNRKTLLENQKVQDEIAAAGPSFEPMKRGLGHYSKEKLFEWAMKMSRQPNAHIERPNRTERRIRAALVCWYCKWAPDFPSKFSPLQPRHPRKRPHPPLINFTIDPFSSMGEPDETDDGRYDPWF
jgi:hypothetical protein